MWLAILFLVGLFPMNRQMPPESPQQAAVRPAVNQPAVQRKIAADDLLEVSVSPATELSATVRVSASGQVALAGVGSFQAVGLTPSQLEQLMLAELLKRDAAGNVRLRVFVREYRTEPVTVLGAVRMPNLYYLEAPRTLLQVLAMAGGMADNTIARNIIIRRKRTVAGAALEKGTRDTVRAAAVSEQIIEIPVSALLQTGDPSLNVYIQPGDVVRVVPTGQYYLAGAVKRPGAYSLADQSRIAIRSALAMAGGLTAGSRARHTLIIRLQPGLPRTERRLDLARLLAAGDEEVSLGPDDVLFVPGNTPKEAALRAIEAGRNFGATVPIAGAGHAPLNNPKRR